jgi:hypothetical protein
MKSIFLSKTVWFNIITSILLVIALPQFISVIPAVALPYIALIAAVGNVILRVFYTSQPTTLNIG